jgi:hypothetical protein
MINTTNKAFKMHEVQVFGKAATNISFKRMLNLGNVFMFHCKKFSIPVLYIKMVITAFYVEAKISFIR